MTGKAKITLTKEQETLLIPLYSKAQPNPILKDEKAREILEGVSYDFGALKVPRKTEVTLRIRARQLDVYTREFIAANPGALVLHLGCGLDSRCLRVAPPATARWIDLDLPDVIELRRKFYPESEAYCMIAASVTDPRWVDEVPAEGRAVFIVAEGLFMYLLEADLRALVVRLHEKFGGAGLVFDAFSKLTVQRVAAHPSLRKTGASIQWGIDDPREIEGWAEGIRLKEECFFSQSPEITRLDWFYRAMFRLTAAIPAVQKVHRLLFYTL